MNLENRSNEPEGYQDQEPELESDKTSKIRELLGLDEGATPTQARKKLGKLYSTLNANTNRSKEEGDLFATIEDLHRAIFSPKGSKARDDKMAELLKSEDSLEKVDYRAEEAVVEPRRPKGNAEEKVISEQEKIDIGNEALIKLFPESEKEAIKEMNASQIEEGRMRLQEYKEEEAEYKKIRKSKKPAKQQEERPFGEGILDEERPIESKKSVETKEEQQRKLAEQYRILAEGIIPPEDREKVREREPKTPEMKNLWKVLENIEDKEEKQKEFDRIIKSFQKGERIYASKEGKVKYYLQLVNITKNERGKINKNSEFQFKAYDQNGQEIEGKMINKKFGELKYREWKKTNEVPDNDDIYVARNGKPVRLQVEQGEKEGQFVLKNADYEGEQSGIKRSLDQLRMHEGAYKDAIKPRSEVAQEFEKKPTSQENKDLGVDLKNPSDEGIDLESGRAKEIMESNKEKLVKIETKKEIIKNEWNKLSKREKEEYKNDKGEPNVKKYVEELEKKREKVNEEIKKHDIPKLPKDVFYELINRGYKPEDIKVKKFKGLTGRVVGSLVLGVPSVIIGAFGGVALGPLVAIPVGLAVGGLCAKFGWEISKRYSGIDVITPTGKKNMTEEDFKDFIENVEEEIQESIKKQAKKSLNDKNANTPKPETPAPEPTPTPESMSVPITEQKEKPKEETKRNYQDKLKKFGHKYKLDYIETKYPEVRDLLEKILSKPISKEERYRLIGDFNASHMKKKEGMYDTISFKDENSNMGSLTIKYYKNGSISISG